MTIRSKQPRFPQLGGEGERYHVMNKAGEPKYSEAGQPETALRFGKMPDLGHEETFHFALSNFLHSVEQASPGELQSGQQWYPKVHEAVRKGIRGGGFLSGHSDKMLAGAGLVAAVSPNMDWEASNIHAFKELRSIKSSGWNTVMSAQEGESRRAKASQAAAKGVFTGMSVAQASLPNLRKAGRIIQGEDPNEVLNPRGAPKTFNFMHNIADPDDHRFATIDGRAFDTMTNRMRPWEVGRGISTANLTRGTSRYEHSRDVVIQAASNFGWSPSATQAVSWEHVKQGIERQSGARKQGPARLGQPYFHPHTGEAAAHILGSYRHLAFAQFQGVGGDDDGGS